MRPSPLITAALAAARRANLARIDAEFDPAHALLRRPPYDNHTHSACAAAAVHVVRESFYAAQALLQANRPGDRARAAAMLGRLCDLQDTRATSRTYGVWPYYAEEPLDHLPSPDVNWADFCGNAILGTLHWHGRLLPARLRTRLWLAARLAAWAVFRRNVTPDYTNIALMGSVLALRVGEHTADPVLVDYGRDKLAAMVSGMQRHGLFTEFNSPTYTLVAIEETERLLHLVSDPLARQSARRLRAALWDMLAAFYHPGSGEFCGPQSRAYHDRLIDDHVLFLARRLGAWPDGHRGAPAAEDPGLVPPLPAPPSARALLLGRATPPVATAALRLCRRPDGVQVTARVWRQASICLGSVSHGTGWRQARPVLGRFVLGDGTIATLRLRLLADGEDFATGEIFSTQVDHRALVLAGFGRNRGSYHLYLDRPADGRITVRSLVLRLELQSPQACGRATGVISELAAGPWKAQLRGGGWWRGRRARTRIVQSPGVAAWELVWCDGVPFSVHLDDLPGAGAWFALALAGPGLPTAHIQTPRVRRRSDRVTVSWPGRQTLRLAADLRKPQRSDDGEAG